jgi:hypothetical protein
MAATSSTTATGMMFRCTQAVTDEMVVDWVNMLMIMMRQ